MYLPITPQLSAASAWLAAANEVRSKGHSAYNVIIDIINPLQEDDIDSQIVKEVDDFLRQHNRISLSGVANTIFPQGLLDRHGNEDFYNVYRETVLPRAKQMTRDWGRYFERLTAWRKIRDGKVAVINPLQDMIEFMQTQVASERTYRNVYELSIYDPSRDAGKVSNRQCLSFLSFKITQTGTLALTVVYRNHAYIARGLGNFIGLGRLQSFVASEVGIEMGNLTCISTHAEIDHSKASKHGVIEGWSSSEAQALLDRCNILNERR